MSEERKMTRYRMEGAVLAVADDNGGWIPVSDTQSLADENARLREALRVAVGTAENLGWVIDQARGHPKGQADGDALSAQYSREFAANPECSAMLRELRGEITTPQPGTAQTPP